MVHFICGRTTFYFPPHLPCVDEYDFPKKTPGILLMVSNAAPLPIPLSVTLSSLLEAHGQVLKLQSVSKSVQAREQATLEPTWGPCFGRVVSSLGHD